MPRAFLVFAAAGLSLVAAGCNSGPQPPQPGTPAFYWAAARSTYAAGDFLKTNDNLSQLSDSADYSTRTQPWALVMSAGLAKGYMDLADNFELGGRANRANPTPFRRQVDQLRRYAGTAAMEEAEIVHKFLGGDKTDPILLEFPYPTGSLSDPVQLQRVAKGMMVPDAEIEDLQRAMLQRGVLFTVTRAVGASDDPAKTQEIFKAGEVKIPRATFLFAISRSLVDEADLYTPTKLDQPDRLNVLCEQATQALESVPASKETKDLATKIGKLRKPGKKS
jgi:hypothetical protein